MKGFKATVCSGLLSALLSLPSLPVQAIDDGNRESTIDPKVVAIDERSFLGSKLVKDYALIDVEGREFNLREITDKPLIILFSYYTCDGLCMTINKHMELLIKGMSRFKPGRDFRVLTVSFDRNDTLESLQKFVKKVGVPTEMREGWRQAILKNQEDIKHFTESVGVRFFWSYRDKVFVHPNAFIFVSPKQRVVRYLYGTRVSASDVELAIIDANWDKIKNSSQVIDILAGVCFSYNFKEGRYTFNYPLMIGVGSLMLGIVLLTVSFKIGKKKFGRIGDARQS